MKNPVKLQDFIKTVSNEILQSQEEGKMELLTPIDFEVSVSVKKEGKGEIDIFVIGAGGKYEKEEVSTIRFSIGNPSSIEQITKVTDLWSKSSKIHNENIQTYLQNMKF